MCREKTIDLNKRKMRFPKVSGIDSFWENSSSLKFKTKKMNRFARFFHSFFLRLYATLSRMGFLRSREGFYLTLNTLLTAATTSCGCGSEAISNDLAYGIGISTPVTRHTGASKWKKVSCSITRATISEPIPKTK